MQPANIRFDRLDEVTEQLQTELVRNSEPYVQTILGIASRINRLQRGSLRNIRVDDLKDQSGHLLFYEIKESRHPVPFDMEFLGLLLSHFKNPTILVLKRIRPFLMASHRRMLARLEEDQARERHLKIGELDLQDRIEEGLTEMKRCQARARLLRSVTRKLDMYAKALHVPAQSQSDFKLITRILGDMHHLRFREARDWLGESDFKGNPKILQKFTRDGSHQLRAASDAVFAEMERLTGIQFPRELSHVGPSFSWYTLGSAQARGASFENILTAEERVENRLKRLTFFMVRSGWDADGFRKTLDENLPDPLQPQENCSKLATLFFELDRRIRESTKPDGEVAIAIQGDVDAGSLSEEEAQEARHWVKTNKIKLQNLKVDVFNVLAEAHKKFPDLALPENLEILLSPRSGEGGDAQGAPRIPDEEISRLGQSLAEFGPRMENPDSKVFVDLCMLRAQIQDLKDDLSDNTLHRRLREAFPDYAVYEEKILAFYEAESRLDELRINCDDWMLECYRVIPYEGVPSQHLDTALDIAIDQTLQRLKKLDYAAVEASRFEPYARGPLKQPAQQALPHLDRLLHEIHSIPRQEQLIQALSDWENTLDRSAYEEKQQFILDNESALQSLVDRIREELREMIQAVEHPPKRLRFEVFGLADAYAGNLESLLQALLRMAPFVARESEGERLIQSIQAIEAQILEAQRLTRPRGEAYDKLESLAKKDVFPEKLIQTLRGDLEENFEALDGLLRQTNQGLERVRQLQNRFGGEHDTEQFAVTINIDDLDRLREVYHFLDNITLMDIKRFGVIYQHKSNLMEELFEKAINKDPSVPTAILKSIDRKVYRAFIQARNVLVPLKTLILREVPEILDSEAQLLSRTLNYVSNHHIRDKAIYKGFLRILEQCQSANIETLRELRRIWIQIRKHLNDFKPANYQKNYENNLKCFLVDVDAMVGHRFEGL